MADKLQFPIDLSHREYDLNGPDGNAFAVMGAVISVIRQMGDALNATTEEIARHCEEYRKNATSGDYENLLQVSDEYVHFNWYRDYNEDDD
jgi:hypothetical protein